MTDDQQPQNKRRKILVAGAAVPLVLATATLGVGPLVRRTALAETPSCGDGPTPRQTAGPFYKPNSPLRRSLVGADASGHIMTLTGRVLSTSCEPVPGALIDFWHCDEKGDYDNRGYNYRGHQHAREDGSYSLKSLLPGIYPGRTRHFHVIVQAPNRAPVVTQLYFPGERLNDRDFLFDPALLINVAADSFPINARFDFVVNVG